MLRIYIFLQRVTKLFPLLLNITILFNLCKVAINKDKIEIFRVETMQRAHQICFRYTCEESSLGGFMQIHDQELIVIP